MGHVVVHWLSFSIFALITNILSSNVFGSCILKVESKRNM